MSGPFAKLYFARSALAFLATLPQATMDCLRQAFVEIKSGAVELRPVHYIPNLYTVTLCDHDIWVSVASARGGRLPTGQVTSIVPENEGP